MHTEQAKLGDLFIPFEQDLKKLGIGLGGFDYKEAVLLTPESLPYSPFDSVIRRYIHNLAQAVETHKTDIHVTANKFSNGNSGLQLPDDSIDVVVNSDLPFGLTSSLTGIKYAALRHRIREDVMREAHRVLKHGGLYLVIEEIPHINHRLYLFEERFLVKKDGYFATLFVRPIQHYARSRRMS
mgnify:CR=1 FL=1